MPFEKYTTKNNIVVWVRGELRGKHREHCLCYSCSEFNPGLPKENCPIANLNYAVCIATGITAPVYECPEFKDKAT